jgi:2-C-methyl-D-erythritol 4-phosphate cytidylyltransferase
MNAAAILLAAGRGERLGEDTPKAFVDLQGRPLLSHAVDSATGCAAISLVVVAVPRGFEERALAHVAHLGERARVVVGGASRQGSVAAALGVLATHGGPVDAVVVHDVARPLATAALFDAVLDGLAVADGVVPGIPVSDTIKRVRRGVVAETLLRDELVAVQTPQAFRRAALERAHAAARGDGVEATDDAALLERIGARVAVVAGNPRNIKVTGPEDLTVASLLVRSG